MQFNVRKLFALSTGLLLLSGCVAFNSVLLEEDDKKPAPPLTTEELRRYLAEWQEARPKVERLSALEDDLALIIEEVNKHSTLKDLPPQFADERATDYLEADPLEYGAVAEMEGDLPPEANEETPERQIYAVQLALFLQERNADVGWQLLQRRHPELLAGLKPKIVEVHREQQSMFSLLVGPFSQKDHAEHLCGAMSQYKYNCNTTTVEQL